MFGAWSAVSGRSAGKPLQPGRVKKPRKALFRAGEVECSIVFARGFAYMD
jgi:hypothetical protein